MDTPYWIDQVRDYAVIRVDLQGKIIGWNEGAKRIFGYDKSEITGRPFASLFTEENIAEGIPETELARSAREGRCEDDRWHQRKDGSVCFVNGMTTSIRDEKGTLAGYVKIARDFTEQRATERRVATQHAATRVLTDTSSFEQAAPEILKAIVEGMEWDFGEIWTVDAKDAVLRRTEKWQRGGAMNLEVPGHSVFTRGEGIVGSVWEQQEPDWVTDLATSPHVARRDSLIRAGLRSALVFPIVSDGKVTGVFIFLSRQKRERDADFLKMMMSVGTQVGQFLKRKKAEADLREAVETAQKAIRAKDQFLAVVSHEMRTPMTSILGWARMLRMGDLDKETYDLALDSIETSSKAQAQLIEDLLDVSRIVAGKLRVDPRPVEIGPILSSVVEMMRPNALEKQIQIETTIPGESCPVLGDPSRLQQVFWNLLTNAIKFTPEGGSIAVVFRSDADNVFVEVRDNGEGIPKELLASIFERFRQGDRSPSSRAGLGLGLAIVRHLVEVHRGEVTAASDGLGKGSVFRVRLPRLRSEELTSPVFVARSDAERYRNLPSLEEMRILFVDDHSSTRDMVAAVLERCGARVNCASTVQQALEMLQHWTPDVVVSDIDMPFEDGCALMTRIRALPDPVQAGVPALALTVMATEADRERILACGFGDHKVKPIEPADLAHAIARIAASKRDPDSSSG